MLKLDGLSKKHMIMIVLSIIFIYGILPYILNYIIPKFNYSETKLGKFHKKYITILEEYHTINGFITLILFGMIIHEIYIIDKLKLHTKLILIGLIICIYIMILFPLLHVYNFYLKLFYSNPPFIKDVNSEYANNIILEKNYPLYKKELYAYMNKIGNINCLHNTLPGFVIANNDEKCWRVLYIKTLGNFKLGFKETCPELYKILDDDRVSNAFISILDPNVNISKHIGYSRSFLRYHLGIDIPEYNGLKPFIVCGNEKYEWSNGKGVIFDDMYQHYVENPTPYQRVVLYLDLYRKDLVHNPVDNLITKISQNNIFVRDFTKKEHQQTKLK